jgi:hypothetical protein
MCETACIQQSSLQVSYLGTPERFVSFDGADRIESSTWCKLTSWSVERLPYQINTARPAKLRLKSVVPRMWSADSKPWVTVPHLPVNSLETNPRPTSLCAQILLLCNRAAKKTTCEVVRDLPYDLFDSALLTAHGNQGRNGSSTLA